MPTVNDFIKHLENLKPSLREAELFIQCPNGLITYPNTKILLNEGYTIFDNVPEKEKVKGTIITWRD